MDLASDPLVSVLLPVLNAATTLPACLRSIQRQTEPRWQCVLVDDGSDDESLACARWFAAQDPRFEVVAAAHQGLVSALRTGLAHCRGRFVARMDADDLMHRQRLSMQVRALEELRVRSFCQTFMLTLHSRVLGRAGSRIQGDRFERPATCLKVWCECSRPFNGHVLQNERAHGQPPSVWCGRCTDALLC